MGVRVTIAFALLPLVGCGRFGTDGDRRAFTTADSWYAPPPPEMEFTPIPKECFAQVEDALQAEAQATLAEMAAKRITAAEAARLAGKSLPVGSEYILLRAVVLFEGTGAFDIGIGNWASSVHIHHGCLSRRAAPMRRKALVAVLKSVPKMVYINCGMVE